MTLQRTFENFNLSRIQVRNGDLLSGWKKFSKVSATTNLLCKRPFQRLSRISLDELQFPLWLVEILTKSDQHRIYSTHNYFAKKFILHPQLLLIFLFQIYSSYNHSQIYNTKFTSYTKFTQSLWKKTYEARVHLDKLAQRWNLVL